MASSWGILMSGMAEFCLPDLEPLSVCVSATVWISYSSPEVILSLLLSRTRSDKHTHTHTLSCSLTISHSHTHTTDLIAPHWSKVSHFKLPFNPGWLHHLKRPSTLARLDLSPCSPEVPNSTWSSICLECFCGHSGTKSRSSSNKEGAETHLSLNAHCRCKV